MDDWLFSKCPDVVFAAEVDFVVHDGWGGEDFFFEISAVFDFKLVSRFDQEHCSALGANEHVIANDKRAGIVFTWDAESLFFKVWFTSVEIDTGYETTRGNHVNAVAIGERGSSIAVGVGRSRHRFLWGKF